MYDAHISINKQYRNQEGNIQDARDRQEIEGLYTYIFTYIYTNGR